MKIVDLCQKIAQLCHIAGELQWEELFKYFVRKIEAGSIGITKREIKSIYGGMGSFNDLVLQKDGAVLDTNEKLSVLREALFEEIIK